MRLLSTAVLTAVWTAIPAAAFNAAALVPANVSVGKNLQTSAVINLSEQAPETGVEITLTSEDPKRLLLSTTPEAAGSASLRLSVKPHFRASPEFWVQALSDSGSVHYTASAPGFSGGKGIVTLSPSGIVIMGPFRGPSFPTTVRGEPSRITLFPVRLDSSSRKHVEQQLIAGGMSFRVNVTSSNTKIGEVSPAAVTLAGAAPNATLEFKPKALGQTSLTAVMPAGFTTPAEHAAVTAVVRAPGIALTGQITIGQNLQLGAVVGLGEAAPDSTEVTITSDDPARLLVSAKAQDVGAESIKVHIPPGQVTSSFFLQALGKSGTVTYRASAPGYTTRTSTIGLSPSGVVVTPSSYGPPDEAELTRKESTETPRGFVASLSKPEKMPLIVWTVQLDPVTLRSADVTVQPLRAGMTLDVVLDSSNASVGSVTSPVRIASGSDHATTHFSPLGVGSTDISVVTPPGFTKSDNSTSVKAIVQK
jgi:hypothetical protein